MQAAPRSWIASPLHERGNCGVRPVTLGGLGQGVELSGFPVQQMHNTVPIGKGQQPAVTRPDQIGALADGERADAVLFAEKLCAV